MASFVRKIKGGRAYLYVVRSARVGGKPRIVSQRYLGPEDVVLAHLERGGEDPARPLQTFVRDSAALHALVDLAERWGVAQVIDEVVGRKRRGLSVGTMLLLAAVNRCLDPRSKAALEAWVDRTILRERLRLGEASLSSQRFWDAMDRVNAQAVQEIEERLFERLVERFEIQPRLTLYDTTNFFTYLDTETSSELAQRGDSKQRRHDLRQLGLALLLDRDEDLPLFAHLYRGNQADVTTFGELGPAVLRRLGRIAKTLEEITLVMDAGNVSKANQSQLDAAPGLGFIAALKPSHARELVEAAGCQLEPVEGMEGLRVWRTEAVVLGGLRTVLVTESEELRRKQWRGLLQHLRKARVQLLELQAATEKRPVLPGRRTAIEVRLRRILAAQHLRKVVRVRWIVREEGLRLRLSYDLRELRRLRRRWFGRRVLVTNRHDWPAAEIVRAYRAQSHVESAFRQMKSPAFASFRPIWHWTDSKLRVHALYCVIALALVALLRRELRRRGVSASAEEALEELHAVKEVEDVHPPRGSTAHQPRAGRRRRIRRWTELSSRQREFIEALGLEKHRPT
jgi:transposase